MSYCVQCGVRLDPGEKHCPLCGVEVINPVQPFDDQAPRPYSRRPDPITEQINRRFIGAMITIALVFPAVLCATINYSLDHTLTWSWHVMGALALLWFILVPYYWLKKRTLNRLFWPVVLALGLFLWLVAWQTGDVSWYLPLALPLVLAPALLLYLNLFLINRRLIRGFVIPALALFSAGLLVLAIELILDAAQGHIQLNWSLYALIPCTAVSLVFLVLARKRSITEQIKRRLHL